ncbi:MAG: 4-hydroxy-3-methylbut-2-enyl diphosphate reductase [Clostridia bacterium]|nr:4-hydroxy-3-methylbut-2-enyl diphosphate reductase [Clostridia bacterium]
MEVVRIAPRGYCYGVVDAMTLAQRVALDPEVPRPIYVLGMIVHNRHVVEWLSRQGVTTLDGEDRAALLDRVDRGTVVFTAHGVSPAVKEKARAKGLTVFDATCPDVTRTHEIIRDRAARGYEIVYIGRKGHPEPEGAMGEAPGRVHLVETAADLEGLSLSTERVAVVTQTTLSQWDTEALVREVLARYPGAEVYNEICLATQLRQQAAVAQGRTCDVVVVVGDERSNNSNRLVEVVREIAGRPAYLVESVRGLRPEWLRGARRVGVTAGSSTPSQLVNEVIAYLEALDPDADDWPEPRSSLAEGGFEVIPRPRVGAGRKSLG